MKVPYAHVNGIDGDKERREFPCPKLKRARRDSNPFMRVNAFTMYSQPAFATENQW